MNRHCLAIFNLDRVDCLKQCLVSLAHNVELETTDIYLLQDGAFNPISKVSHAKEQDIEACVKLFKNSNLPNKYIYRHWYNVGVAMQNYTVSRCLIPMYEYISVVDNDLVFNKYYLKTVKTLFEQFKDDEEIGMLQTSFGGMGGRIQDKKTAKENESKIAQGFSHRCERNFWREKWPRIEEELESYYALVRDCDYSRLHHSDDHNDVKEKIMDEWGTIYNDFVLEIATKRAGYKGIHTESLRYKIAGRSGRFSFKGNRHERTNYNNNIK